MNTWPLREEFDILVTATITEESGARILEIIRLIGEVDSDDEVAHSMEDEFRTKVLKQIDHPLAKLALKTGEFDFARWCA